MKVFIRYKSPLVYLIQGLTCLFVSIIFLFTIFKADGFFLIIIIFLLILTTCVGAIFVYYFLSNNISKYIILKEHEIVLPLKWSNKVQKIKYSKIQNVEIVKYSSEFMSRYEYNLLIETKTHIFYIEKSWVKSLDNLKLLSEKITQKLNND